MKKLNEGSFLTRVEYRRLLVLLGVSIVTGLLMVVILVMLYKPLVKANGDSGLYHTANCPSYNSTVIGNNEQDAFYWTEEQAREKGFVLAGNCK